MDIFKQKEFKELLNYTPVSLFIKSYADALDETSDKEFFDKPLINKLKNFQKVFTSEKETILFYNEEADPKLTLKKSDFKKISLLEKETPDPQVILLNGIVEVMEYSKRRVKIITDSGQVEAYLSEKIHPDDIKEYWGHKVTISGTANYRYGGKLGFVEIEKIFKPSESDKYFSKIITSETTEQQIQRQLKEKDYKNNLGELVGKLQTDESVEELLKMLTK